MSRVVEMGFTKKGVEHVHAEPGEVGQVLEVIDGHPLVKWERTGTICDCAPEEVQRAISA